MHLVCGEPSSGGEVFLKALESKGGKNGGEEGKHGGKKPDSL